MQLKTGRFMCANVKTGWTMLIGELTILAVSSYQNMALIAAIAGMTLFIAMLLTDILDVEGRAGKQDRRFMAQYTFMGAVGIVSSTASYVANSFRILPGAEVHTMPIVVGIVIAVTLGLTILQRRGVFPKQTSNITGWSQLIFFGLMTAAVAAKSVWPWLWPNLPLLVVGIGWFVGAVLYFTTSRRFSGYIGFATVNVILAGSICEVLEAVLRSSGFPFLSYFWMGMPVVLGMFLINAWINYRAINGAPKIEYIKLKK